MERKTLKYNVWLQIEEHYLDEDGNEQHKDIEDIDACAKYGEFETLQEAQHCIAGMENTIVIPVQRITIKDPLCGIPEGTSVDVLCEQQGSYLVNWQGRVKTVAPWDAYEI